MPPRATPPTAGKPRRRPGPPVSGAWIWMVIGLALVAMLLFNTFNNSVEIPYSASVTLIDEKNKDNIQKLSFGTNDRIFGEIRNVESLPTGTEEERELKQRFEKKRTNKFVTKRWPLTDLALSQELN